MHVCRTATYILQHTVTITFSAASPETGKPFFKDHKEKTKKSQQQPRTPVKGVGGGGGVLDGRENSNTLLSKNTSLKALEVAQGQTEYQFQIKYIFKKIIKKLR